MLVVGVFDIILFNYHSIALVHFVRVDLKNKKNVVTYIREYTIYNNTMLPNLTQHTKSKFSGKASPCSVTKRLKSRLMVLKLQRSKTLRVGQIGLLNAPSVQFSNTVAKYSGLIDAHIVNHGVKTDFPPRINASTQR